MNSDAALLKLFLSRDNFEAYRSYVDDAILSREVKAVLSGVKQYFKKFPKDKEIDIDQFRLYWSQVLHPEHSADDLLLYEAIFEAVDKVPAELENSLLLAYCEKNTKSLIVDSLARGFDAEKLEEILKAHRQSTIELIEQEDKDVFINDVNTLFAVDTRKNGIKWRLDFLNRTVGSVTKGTFILVGAYTDVGKTSFCISEAVYAAKQIESDVLFLNNEEFNERVMSKIWKCVTGMSESDIRLNREVAKQRYIRELGRLDKIKLVDIRNKTFDQVKNLFNLYKPGYVVVDQVDKIENMSHKSFTNHDRLKKLYGEFRTLCNAWCPVVAVSQADVSTVAISKDDVNGEAEYQRYPHHRQLDGSKIGKAGEMDVIIMIGRDASNSTRYINVSKNKFGINGRTQVFYDGDLCRYSDGQDDEI